MPVRDERGPEDGGAKSSCSPVSPVVRAFAHQRVHKAVPRITETEESKAWAMA